MSRSQSPFIRSTVGLSEYLGLSRNQFLAALESDHQLQAIVKVDGKRRFARQSDLDSYMNDKPSVRGAEPVSSVR